MWNDNLNSLVVDGLLPEVIHEPEEPDSAFEATQYFFEDITPDTSMGESSFQNLLFRVTESYVYEQEAFHTFSCSATYPKDEETFTLFLFCLYLKIFTFPRLSCNNLKPTSSVH